MSEAKTARKPIYRTNTPFSLPRPTPLAQPHHDVLVDLLVSALSPIGSYRANLPKPSKKRSKKRKRIAGNEQTEPQTQHVASKMAQSTIVPDPPAFKDSVLVGFNSVTRHLEELVKVSKESGEASPGQPRHIAAVFLFRPMDDVLYNHLPSLCQMASRNRSESTATRLVLLDQSVEKKIAAAMALSQGVSLLAVLDNTEEGSADTQALMTFVREHVAATEVPWLKHAAGAEWLPTKIDEQ